jgi:hypothetical protein
VSREPAYPDARHRLPRVTSTDNDGETAFHRYPPCWGSLAANARGIYARWRQGQRSPIGTLRKSGRFALRAAKGSKFEFAAVSTNDRKWRILALSMLGANVRFALNSGRSG